MAEILVVDDERIVREALKAVLEGEGHVVRLATTGEDALEKYRASRPDLILLDVMMPGRNGYSVCEEIRRGDATIPVLFLTAVEAEANEIRGMAVGGDDYILKTAPTEVMLARVRRALDRQNRQAAALHFSELRLGAARIDFTARCILFEDGSSERLTGAELDILRALASDRSRYFTLDEICVMMHGENHRIEAGTLRSQISRLKLKLGKCGELIHSERFLGYRLLP